MCHLVPHGSFFLLLFWCAIAFVECFGVDLVGLSETTAVLRGHWRIAEEPRGSCDRTYAIVLHELMTI